MQAKSKWKPWHKWTIGVLSLFIILIVVAVNSEDSSKEQSVMSPTNAQYISARNFKIEAEKNDFEFTGPVDFDTMQRINCRKDGLFMNVFYRNDTVFNAHMVLSIGANRENLSDNLVPYEKLISIIDPAGTEWVKKTIAAKDAKKEFEEKAPINVNNFSLMYTPDVNKDVLVVDVSPIR